MLQTDRLWRAAVGFLPILITVATLGPLAGLAHVGIGIVVLGVAVCLSTARRTARPTDRGGPGPVLVATVGVGLLGAAFATSLVLGDTIFLAVLLGSRLLGHFGPRWARLGRSLLLPLTALFLAPPVAIGHNPWLSLAWSAIACLVASAWCAIVATVLPTPRSSVSAVSRAVRRALTGGPRASRALSEAALALDAKLADAPAARRALAELEYTVDCVRAGAGRPSDVDVAIDRLAVAVRTSAPNAASEVAEVAEPEPVEEAGPSARVRTRLAAQSTIAMALAFIVGQSVFPEHWPWTAITVITVSLAARSRGEVLLRSGQRLAGAAGATIVATPLAAALAHRPGLSIGAILIVLAAGLYLRERSYVYWAIAITATLAFLYGLLGQGGGLSLLGERLLAIGLGALCAIVPAIWLAPRSVDVVRKRTAVCLRRLRDALAAERLDVAALRRVDTALVDLRAAAAPLTVIRQVRRRPELGWVDAMTACGPPLRTLLVQPDRQTAAGLRRVLADVAGQVRITPRPPADGGTRRGKAPS